MTQLTIEEIKNRQVQILKNLSEYCSRNNLKYIAAYGTMLGAVRHKGFIPWDDDIDVVMPRSDYDKLVQSYSSDTFELLCLEHKSNYFYPFAKLCQKNTRMEEIDNRLSEIGVNIDVFPMDYVTDDAQSEINRKKIHRLKRMMQHKYSARKSGGMRAVLRSIYRLLTFPISLRAIGKRIDQMARSSCGKEKIATLCWDPYILFDADFFDEIISVPFENIIVSIPKNYDYWLRTKYGDYMQLPPESERVNRHAMAAYEL